MLSVGAVQFTTVRGASPTNLRQLVQRIKIQINDSVERGESYGYKFKGDSFDSVEFSVLPPETAMSSNQTYPRFQDGQAEAILEITFDPTRRSKGIDWKKVSLKVTNKDTGEVVFAKHPQGYYKGDKGDFAKMFIYVPKGNYVFDLVKERKIKDSTAL